MGSVSVVAGITAAAAAAADATARLILPPSLVVLLLRREDTAGVVLHADCTSECGARRVLQTAALMRRPQCLERGGLGVHDGQRHAQGWPGIVDQGWCCVQPCVDGGTRPLRGKIPSCWSDCFVPECFHHSCQAL